MAEKKQYLFEKNIAAKGDALFKERGARINSATKEVMMKIAMEYRGAVRQYQDKIEDMLDLGPNNMYSLTPKSIDSDSWSRDYVSNKVQLELAERKLKVAEDTLMDLFGAKLPE